MALCSIVLSFQVFGVLMFPVISGLSEFLRAHRLLNIPLSSVPAAVGLFFLYEFIYYWEHRLSHHIRWLWASHSVHHSMKELTVISAQRLGWTNALSGLWLFFIPLVWIGFDPRAVAVAITFDLLYQAWLHTDLIPKLGWVEGILNTPSHHRVHHAIDKPYLDKNFGGVLIIYDRLFGTYAEESNEQPCHYGIVGRPTSYNPICLAFHEWLAIFRDLKTASSWRERFVLAFGNPGRESG